MNPRQELLNHLTERHPKVSYGRYKRLLFDNLVKFHRLDHAEHAVSLGHAVEDVGLATKTNGPPTLDVIPAEEQARLLDRNAADRLTLIAPYEELPDEYVVLAHRDANGSRRYHSEKVVGSVYDASPHRNKSHRWQYGRASEYEIRNNCWDYDDQKEARGETV